MLFGSREVFAIEAYHEPITNDYGRVHGRVCIWVKSTQLGNISEPACILGTVQVEFSDLLSQLPLLADSALDCLSDQEAFDFLDAALYLDDARTAAQVQRDKTRYSRFNFLTNCSEAFNGLKAFVLRAPIGIRILYQLGDDTKGSASIAEEDLVHSARTFIAWVNAETTRGSIQ